jgi:hypothetical protein
VVCRPANAGLVGVATMDTDTPDWEDEGIVGGG